MYSAARRGGYLAGPGATRETRGLSERPRGAERRAVRPRGARRRSSCTLAVFRTAWWRTLPADTFSLPRCSVAELRPAGTHFRRHSPLWPCCYGWLRGLSKWQCLNRSDGGSSRRIGSVHVFREPSVSARGSASTNSFQEREYLALVVLRERIRMFSFKSSLLRST